MAETTYDVRDLPREQAYAQLTEQVDSVLEGMDDPICAMASISAVLQHGFGHLWTGFYRVAQPGRLLRIGPYQGTLGCLEIPFGRGVCGTAAAESRTVIVADVQAFPGHIVCDPRARSEIVVPVFDSEANLLAVLDVDSAELDAFTDVDARALEKMLGWFTRLPRPASTRS